MWFYSYWHRMRICILPYSRMHCISTYSPVFHQRKYTFISRIQLCFTQCRIFAFTREPMKWNFSLFWLKFWLAKKWRWACVLPRQERAFPNYQDHAKVIVTFKRWCNCWISYESCCSHNQLTLRGEIQTGNN